MLQSSIDQCFGESIFDIVRTGLCGRNGPQMTQTFKVGIGEFTCGVAQGTWLISDRHDSAFIPDVVFPSASFPITSPAKNP